MKYGDIRIPETSRELTLISLLGFRRHTRLVATFALVFATLIATQGAIVRATRSGLGCPDWPLCYGSITPPPDDINAIIEYTHRVLAGIGGLAILAAAVLALMSRGESRLFRGAGGALIILLGVQVLLGAAAVLAELPAWVVTAHLMSATTLIGLLTLVVVLSSMRPQNLVKDQPHLAGLSRLSVAAVIAALLVIGAGGYTASSNAGTACPGWPLCGNAMLPIASQGIGPVVHMVHRAAGLAVLILVATLAWRLRRLHEHYPLAARLGIIAGHLVALEVLVGVANVMSLSNEIITAIHSFLAQWVWIVTLAIAVVLWSTGRESARSRAELDS
jgi:heme A synthase